MECVIFEIDCSYYLCNQKAIAWDGIGNWSLFQMCVWKGDLMASVLVRVSITNISQGLSLCLFRPVSSLLHISSSCSSYSYWSCHLPALGAPEPTSAAALHSVLPRGHPALHELHGVLPQVRLWGRGDDGQEQRTPVIAAAWVHRRMSPATWQVSRAGCSFWSYISLSKKVVSRQPECFFFYPSLIWQHSLLAYLCIQLSFFPSVLGLLVSKPSNHYKRLTVSCEWITKWENLWWGQLIFKNSCQPKIDKDCFKFYRACILSPLSLY